MRCSGGRNKACYAVFCLLGGRALLGTPHIMRCSGGRNKACYALFYGVVLHVMPCSPGRKLNYTGSSIAPLSVFQARHSCDENLVILPAGCNIESEVERLGFNPSGFSAQKV